jgi:hypothetical protein
MADKWHVVQQTLTTELSNSGTGFMPVWNVTYMVDSGPATGTQGKVNVPAAQFNADTVKAAIEAAVYHLDQVASL